MLTTPKHEKAAVKHLDIAGVETFLPTYESPRVWKNRQKVNVQLPLFPTYLFVRIDHQDRGKVLRAPGVRQLVGTSREALPLPDHEIEFLRNSLWEQKAEPYLGPGRGPAGSHQERRHAGRGRLPDSKEQWMAFRAHGRDHSPTRGCRGGCINPGANPRLTRVAICINHRYLPHCLPASSEPTRILEIRR